MHQDIAEQRSKAEAILRTLGERQTFEDPTMENMYFLPDGKTVIDVSELYGDLCLTIQTKDYSLLPKILSELQQSLSNSLKGSI